MPSPLQFFRRCLLASTTILLTLDPVQGQRAAPEVTSRLTLETVRDATLGSVNTGYATPSYLTQDVPRLVLLSYSTGLADPRSLVQVDVQAVGSDLPVKFSILVRNEFAALMQLEGGTTEQFHTAGAGAQRISAHFIESRPEPHSYVYDVVVRSWWADGTFLEAPPVGVRAAKLSTQGSAFGHGWYVTGIPRLYLQSEGIHLVEDGVGGWYSQSCDLSGCTYSSPPGDYSTLVEASPTTFERRYQTGEVDVFSSTGLVTSRRDRYGNLTRFYWTATRLDSIQDPAIRSFKFGYHANGKLAWIDDPMGRRSTVTIAANGTLTTIQDPAGQNVLNLGYTTDYRLLWSRDQANRQTDYLYDDHGKVARVSTPQFQSSVGLISAQTNYVSLETALLPEAGQGTSSSPAPRVKADSLELRVTDPRGYVTRAYLDSLQSVRVTIDPLGRQTIIARDGAGQVTRTITPTADTTNYSYLGFGRLVRILNPRSGVDTRFTYTDDNQIRTATGGPLHTINEYERDSTDVLGSGGRLLLSRVGSQVNAYMYEGDHRPHRVFGPGTDVFHFHNAPGANVSETFSRGMWTFHHRDIYGRVVKTRYTIDYNQRGDSVLTEYDLANRLTAVVDPSGNRTTYEYTDSVTRVIDAKGQAYETVHNALGWPKSRKDPRGLTEHYLYDQVGNLVQHTNRRGQTVGYTYDAVRRMTSQTADGQSITFVHHPLDSLLVTTSPETVDSVRVIPNDPVPGATTIVQSTGRSGIRFRLRSMHSGLFPPSLQSEGAWNSYSVGFGVLPDSSFRVTDVCNPVDLFCTQKPTSLLYPQDNTLRLRSGTDTITATGVSIRFNRTALNDELGLDLVRDTAGRVVSRKNVAADSIRAFSYNRLGQLFLAGDSLRVPTDYSGCPPLDLTDPCWAQPPFSYVFEPSTYTYDQVGNRTDNDAVVTNSNRMEEFGGFVMGYDQDGNLTSKEALGFDQVFTWNSRNQLVQVVTNGQTTTYGYDGAGRRVRKTVGGVVTRYVYDGQRIVAELDGAGTVVAEYIHLPGSDRPHILVRGGQRYVYMIDGPGNVVGLIDQQGNLVNRYRYGPWGEPEVVEETVPQPFRFTGREYDPETQLYYYRARYYDPDVGRFISEDPIGLAGGINPYAYVENDPVNTRDPSGLCSGRNVAYGATIHFPGPGANTHYLPCPGKLAGFYAWIIRFTTDRNSDCRYERECDNPQTEEERIQQEVDELREQLLIQEAERAEAAWRSNPANDAEAFAFMMKDRAIVMAPVLNAAASLALTPIYLTLPEMLPGTGGMAVLQLRQPTVLAENVVKGRAFESAVGQAVGLAKNTRRIEALSVGSKARYRIPDYFSDVAIIEAKNVGYLRYTSQLKDYVAWIEANPGYRLDLYVRSTTQFSTELERLRALGILTRINVW